jgi:hypothetical protein
MRVTSSAVTAAEFRNEVVDLLLREAAQSDGRAKAALRRAAQIEHEAEAATYRCLAQTLARIEFKADAAEPPSATSPEVTVSFPVIMNALGVASDEYAGVSKMLNARGVRDTVAVIEQEYDLLLAIRAALRDGADTIKIVR